MYRCGSETLLEVFDVTILLQVLKLGASGDSVCAQKTDYERLGFFWAKVWNCIFSVL